MRWGLLLACMVASTAHASWPVLGEGGRTTRRTVEPEELFTEVDACWQDADVASNPRDLGLVADSALRSLERRDASGNPPPHGMLDALDVSPEDIRDTLRFIGDVAREDAGAPYQRLADPDWIEAHFRVLRFHPDTEQAARHHVRLAEDQLRLTRYLVYRFPGSLERTASEDTALYSLPDDELSAAGSLGPHLLRMLLTRRDVLDGIFEAGGAHAGRAQPLVYLSREHVHQALLQGTVQVELPDGDVRTYAVHKNNGRPYRRGVDHEGQDRFWYFRERPTDPRGGTNTGIRLLSGVAVAGDVNNLGLGGVYALEGDDGTLRIVVMADTGGAFQPNLYQMDLFTGTHESLDALNIATADVPRRPGAYLLVLRDDIPR